MIIRGFGIGELSRSLSCIKPCPGRFRVSYPLFAMGEEPQPADSCTNFLEEDSFLDFDAGIGDLNSLFSGVT